MEILIIQIGDIHIKSEKDSILSKKDKIIDCLKNNLNGVKAIFIAISGDIAFSGSVAQYDIAKSFINNLQEGLQKHTSVKIHTIAVAGNHDCILKSEDEETQEEIEIRELIIEKIKSDKSAIKTSTFKKCTSVQKNYFLFENEIADNAFLKEDSNRIFKRYQFEIEGKEIVFNCFNSAWISELPEKPGQLLFPVSQIPPVNEECDLIVSLQHHSYNWFEPNNRKELVKETEKKSDIILTGHEHVSNSSLSIDQDNSFTEYVDGGVLQDSNNEEKSEFNIINVNFELKEFQNQKVSWNNLKYEIGEPSIYSFARFSRSTSNKLEFKEDFYHHLIAPNVNFTHPHKDKVSLKDTYIYPNLKDLDLEKKEDEDTKCSKELGNELLEHKKILITGEERSGKSTLIKEYTRSLHGAGVIPILVKGKDISATSSKEFVKIVKQQFNSQFINSDSFLFDQFDYNKVFIIIDDYDQINIKNNKYKQRLILNIQEYFPNIIITGNTFLQFQDFLSGSTNPFEEFKKYEIKEFGKYLQYKLIKKWHGIGLHDFFSEEDLIAKTDTSHDLIKHILGKNLVPSYPIFILTILQASESFTNRNKNVSSYGFYYELLLKDSLYKVVKEDDEIYLYFNILSEFAYFLYTEEIKNISESNFSDFIKQYCSDYKLTVNYEKILTNLRLAGYLSDLESYIEFKYSYIYYYFLANYMANNIQESDVVKRISLMCSQLHKEDYSNIIMFLTHLSNDSTVRDTLISNAKEMFPEHEIKHLDGDVSNINELSIEYTPLVFNESHDVIEFRENELKKEDQFENKNLPKRDEVDISDDDDSEDFNLISQLNRSMKTIEIMGQIAKKHYGSIKGQEKFDLTKETFDLGLRSLSNVLDLFEQINDFILDELKSRIEKKKIDNKSEAEKEAKSLLFEINTMICFGMIKKVCYAIGSPKLDQVYKEIIELNPINSYKLMWTSIQLDSRSSLPVDDLEKLNISFKQNALARKVLQHMVLHHLKRHPISDFRVKQKLCSSVGIKMETQRQLEAKASN